MKHGELKTVDGKLVYSPIAGSDISTVSVEVVREAKRHNCPVAFDFNGIEITALPDSVPADLKQQYWNETNRRAEEYRNSPEGKLQAQKRRREAARHQKRAVELVEALPGLVRDVDKLLPWLVEYAYVTDDVDVNVPHKDVVVELEAVWKENAHVGRPKEDFKDRTVAAEYIIGQAINCMKQGMPPHPIIEQFVEDWKKLAA